MDQLKPCPFCGGSAQLVQPGNRRHSCIVECEDCGCRLESSDEETQSGAAWNRRAALSSQCAAGEAEPEWVAQVVSSGPHDFPLLQWRSADVSFRVPIGTKLYASPLPIHQQKDGGGVEAEFRMCGEGYFDAEGKLWNASSTTGFLGVRPEDEAKGCRIEPVYRRVPPVVAASSSPQPTADECNIANRMLDMLMREAHGTTVWPGNWIGVRDQIIAAIRTAGVETSAQPQGEK